MQENKLYEKKEIFDFNVCWNFHPHEHFLNTYTFFKQLIYIFIRKISIKLFQLFFALSHMYIIRYSETLSFVFYSELANLHTTTYKNEIKE